MGRALDSLLAQTHDNLEIFVSDNYSTDRTYEICREYEKKDSRVSVCRNKSNVGIIENFRIVLQKARGEFFMWAAGDDCWKPKFLEALINQMAENPEAGTALCAVRREYPGGTLKDVIRFDEEIGDKPQSALRTASRLLSPLKKTKMLKYNLFICGLFRRRIAEGILDKNPEILDLGERPFLALVALSSGFVFVNRKLFVKMVYRTRFKERKQGDSYKKNFDPFRYYLDTAVHILRAGSIPIQRKVFVVAVMRYALEILLSRAKKKAKAFLEMGE